MARMPRLPFIPFGWYYVALYGNSGRDLITSASDLEMFVGIWRAALKKKGAHLHAGSVIRTEAHFALQAGETSVSAITRHFCHEYARRFNRTHRRRGWLFRSHPHVLLIQHGSWLVPVVHVIHWIPRLAGLESPADLVWSSDAVYRRYARQEGLITHVVFNMLSKDARRRNVQEEAYRVLFDTAPDAATVRALAQGSAEDPRILGDAAFIESVWHRTHQRSPRRAPPALPPDIDPVVVAAVEQFRLLCGQPAAQPRAISWRPIVTVDGLRSQSRKQPLPMMRAIIASHAIRRGLATRTQMAVFFGCRPETLAAHRRRYYELAFRKEFGVTPGLLFG